MNDFIDIYCERTAPGFWDEPLNALSNAAFLIAAFAAALLARRENALNAQTGTLITILTAIGIGSFLFHTYATVWAKFADVIPILLYQIAFISIYARTIMGVGSAKVAGLLLLFVALSVGSGMLPYDWLNGSLGYAPALVFLIGFGVYHRKKQKVEPNIYLASAAVFTLSLTFRSIDMAVCEALAIGVHYFWHILNGVTLYLTLRGLIVNWPPRPLRKNTSQDQ